MSRQSLARPGVFLSRHNVFMSQQSWKWWRGFVSQQNILCRDRVGHDRKLCRTQQSWAYKASAHDSVAPCCVVREEARRSRQTLGAQDRGVRVRQRNSIAIDLYNDEKKNPRVWGVIARVQASPEDGSGSEGGGSESGSSNGVGYGRATAVTIMELNSYNVHGEEEKEKENKTRSNTRVNFLHMEEVL